MANDVLIENEKITDQWATPWDFFNELHKEFNFTLDVCASPENAKCNDYYTVDQNALCLPWTTSGTAWCNPPYSHAKQWVEKSYNESLAGQRVVMLLNVATDTSYWHQYIFPFAEIRFLRGRVRFVPPPLRQPAQDAPRYANAVIIFHPYSNERFSADRVISEDFSTFVNHFRPNYPP
jgi:phage N-6-adenine-methyltransferase